MAGFSRSTATNLVNKVAVSGCIASKVLAVMPCKSQGATAGLAELKTCIQLESHLQDTFDA